ncbi:MAG: hypothetical protein NTX25_19100, partial [Proteobacteria bacterium]|nr:hypothetical protein [Pseudomonadota bacterium]
MASNAISLGSVEFLSRLEFSDKELSNFDCGKEPLNKWLKQFSKNGSKKGITTTIMVPKGKKSPILGYATVCASTVEKENLPEERRSGLGSYPVPVILIARLAISNQYHGQGLGKHYLMHIYITVHETIKRGIVGARGIIVDAKDQE